MTKARENRLRYRAALQGMLMERSRARLPEAPGRGTYRLRDKRTGRTIHGRKDLGGYGLTLDDVELALP